MPAADTAHTATVPAGLAAEFIAAGHTYHVPPAVLAAVAQVESGMGSNRGPSSAGAIGLMQFEPGTASDLGINPRNDREAIWGAAKYLHQLGYSTDPVHALSSYNAGPAATGAARAQGNAYASTVQGWATHFAGQLAGGSSASNPLRTGATGATGSTPAGSTPGASFGAQLLQLAFTVALVAAGAVLVFIGVRYTLAGAKT
jgi:membrane-bound lytic murein transglycosylase B